MDYMSASYVHVARHLARLIGGMETSQTAKMNISGPLRCYRPIAGFLIVAMKTKMAALISLKMNSNSTAVTPL